MLVLYTEGDFFVVGDMTECEDEGGEDLGITLLLLPQNCLSLEFA